MSDRVQITGRIHVATREGRPGSCRDESGRWAVPFCGTRSAKVRPIYVASDRQVTCVKCL